MDKSDVKMYIVKAAFYQTCCQPVVRTFSTKKFHEPDDSVAVFNWHTNCFVENMLVIGSQQVYDTFI